MYTYMYKNHQRTT